jgi:hypothetical protein
MNVEIGTLSVQFLYWQYINGIFVAVQKITCELFCFLVTEKNQFCVDIYLIS